MQRTSAYWESSPGAVSLEMARAVPQQTQSATPPQRRDSLPESTAPARVPDSRTSFDQHSDPVSRKSSITKSNSTNSNAIDVSSKVSGSKLALLTSRQSMVSLINLNISSSGSFRTYFQTKPAFHLSSDIKASKSHLAGPSTSQGKLKTHNFSLSNFPCPTKCCVCSGLMRGVIRQGFSCAKCKYACHSACRPLIPAAHMICPLRNSIVGEPQAEDAITQVRTERTSSDNL
jgi:hypothetical protein